MPDVEGAIRFISARPRPLALFLFTRSKADEKAVFARCHFGGGCVNDTIIHLATHEMGFGGVGQSGMGSYHGKRSFETFSHEESLVKKALWLDLPFRYRPYTKEKGAHHPPRDALNRRPAARPGFPGAAAPQKRGAVCRQNSTSINFYSNYDEDGRLASRHGARRVSHHHALY